MEFWRIKDDIYNIYRIRNMLVHKSFTKSNLLDYYAKRSLDYSFNLIEFLKLKIMQTKSDEEILSIEEYFQNIVINANIALESLQNGDIEKFKEWVFLV